MKDRICQFGPFTLDPAERRLLRNGTALNVPPKLFDLLLHFVSNAGKLISKQELMDVVSGRARSSRKRRWRGRFRI
jgi:DNA-binding winged helix-turn-helix (wHTH) protein